MKASAASICPGSISITSGQCFLIWKRSEKKQIIRNKTLAWKDFLHFGLTLAGSTRLFSTGGNAHPVHYFACINCDELRLAHVCPITFLVVWKTSLLPKKVFVFFFAWSQRCLWFKAEAFGKLSIRLSVWWIVLTLTFSRAAAEGMSDRCAWFALRGSGKSKEQYQILTCNMIFRFQKSLLIVPAWRCIAFFPIWLLKMQE